MNKTDRMAVIFREMLETYKAKNADYGDSFSKSFKEFGLTAPVVRISDKVERLKALSKADAKVKDESIRDTLIDLANYAVMTAMELENVGRVDFHIGDEVYFSTPYTEGNKLNI